MTEATGPDDTRTDPPMHTDERATVAAYLDYHRDTLSRKCAGLTGAQLASRPLPSTTLSLQGLVRHLTIVERWWFRDVLLGQDNPPMYYTEERPDDDFDATDPAQAEEEHRVWLEEIEACRAAADELDLSTPSVRRIRGGEQPSLRWIYLHMLEEHARHNGHADLLREAIDGTTGE